MSADQRFDPMKEIQNIGEHISKQIEKGIRNVTSGSEQLAVDMYEADQQLVIRTGAIDGLLKESIEISLENDVLTILCQTEAEATPTTARYFLQERRFGTISRSVELPMPVKGDEARAKVESGTRLVVTMPVDSSVYGNITVTPVE